MSLFEQEAKSQMLWRVNEEFCSAFRAFGIDSVLPGHGWWLSLPRNLKEEDYSGISKVC